MLTEQFIETLTTILDKKFDRDKIGVELPLDSEDGDILITIDSKNWLHIELGYQSATVFFSLEQEDFLRASFESDEEYIKHVIGFCLALLHYKIEFQYYYSKGELVKYKIYFIDKESGERSLTRARNIKNSGGVRSVFGKKTREDIVIEYEVKYIKGWPEEEE